MPFDHFPPTSNGGDPYSGPHEGYNGFSPSSYGPSGPDDSAHSPGLAGGRRSGSASPQPTSFAEAEAAGGGGGSYTNGGVNATDFYGRLKSYLFNPTTHYARNSAQLLAFL